jgi:hypothetical protein
MKRVFLAAAVTFVLAQASLAGGLAPAITPDAIVADTAASSAGAIIELAVILLVVAGAVAGR